MIDTRSVYCTYCTEFSGCSVCVTSLTDHTLTLLATKKGGGAMTQLPALDGKKYGKVQTVLMQYNLGGL